MTYLAAESAIIADFSSKWASTTPVKWPNVRFDNDNVSEFVAFNINTGLDEQITLGSDVNDHRKYGVVIVQIFTELNGGAMRSAQLVDSVVAMFKNNFDVTGVVFGDMDVVTVGQNEGYYQVNVEIAFYRNEQH